MNSMRPWSGSCQRCGQEGNAYTMSVFSLLLICPACKEAERLHPDHERAATAELASVQNGVMDFPGIGEPGPCLWQLENGTLVCGRCRPDGTELTPVWSTDSAVRGCSSSTCPRKTS